MAQLPGPATFPVTESHTAMNYILSLDQGTTSSRAILFDQAGVAVDLAQQELPQIYPQAGWVEHDPEEIWRTQRDVMLQLVARNRLQQGDLAAIAVANQRETALAWDRRTGEPIANAVVWQDRRTAGRCDQLQRDGMAALFQERTGLVLDAYFSGTKWEWLLDQVPNARRRAEAGELALGTVDSWLVWKLTGGRVHVTDVSNASRTLLFNIHTAEWDDRLLEVLRLPREGLPRVASSSEIFGETDDGLPFAGIPIAGIAGDQQAALFGHLCTRPGMVKNTYGTGCFMLMHTGETAVTSQHQLLTTIAWQLGDRIEYALEGSVFTAGAIVQWLRDGLGLIDDAAQIEALAASVSSSDGVYLVPAFTGLGAPHWDPYARGLIVGLTRSSHRGHLARAALEAIAFSVDDVLQAMQQDAGRPIAELRVDGGASVNNLLLQIQADLLGVPVLRPRERESTALGGAYLAGLAVGFWDSLTALGDRAKIDREFAPQLSADEVGELKRGWARAVERSRDWSGRDV